MGRKINNSILSLGERVAEGRVRGKNLGFIHLHLLLHKFF